MVFSVGSLYTGSDRIGEGLRKRRIPPNYTVVVDGPLDGNLFTDEPHSLPGPGDGGVEQVALEHPTLAGHDG